jgi:hypothetical protein
MDQLEKDGNNEDRHEIQGTLSTQQMTALDSRRN